MPYPLSFHAPKLVGYTPKKAHCLYKMSVSCHFDRIVKPLKTTRACPLPCSQGSGYSVLPLVGAAHHASRRVPTIPHAGFPTSRSTLPTKYSYPPYHKPHQIAYICAMQHLNTEKHFQAEAQLKSFDRRHRQVINYNITQYHHSVAKGKLQYADLEQARRLAKHIKWATIEHLDKHLLHFEQQITARGAQVIWASNAAEALTAIENIVRRHQAQRIVKSKTMISEELGLNEFLEQHGLNVLETDLGEYVAQLAGEKPYHIVTPIMQKSKQDVADLFHKQFGTPITDTPEQTMAFVRTQLRTQMHNADIGISGANFLIAETGSLVLTENEGNIRLCTTFPKVHIAIAGIERVLPKLAHLDVFLPLLATFGTGQKLTTYNTLISGARLADSELDGPEHLYVILLDNGRTLPPCRRTKTRKPILYPLRCLPQCLPCI
jgi:L-lactate dehydrogenase complex protein LldF